MPNGIRDLMGITFGRLVPLRRLEEKQHGSYLWELRCVCGNHVTRPAGALIKHQNGGHQSCGCGREVDLPLATKIGHLTPLRKLEKDRDRGFLYEFLCDCGKTVVKIGSQVLRKQGALHCGCIKNRGGNWIDLRGKRFGELQVIDFAPSGKRDERRWMCQCSCGKVISVSSAEITIRKRHCGCKRKYGPFNKHFRGLGQLYQSYWTRLQRGAEIRNLAFTITREYVLAIFTAQHGLCALSGIPITLGVPGKQQTASLDRRDSLIGYVEGNVQWVHKQLNWCKQDLTDDDFIEWCGRVWNHRAGAAIG